MKLEVTTLDATKAGSIDLDDAVFGVTVRQDLMSRAVNWQLAKRRAGTASTKTRSEVHGTTKKAYRQKGTGRARRGNLKTNIMRGGGVSHGPKPRDYETSFPRKLRQLALKSALSAKAADGKLIVLDEAKMKSHKTKELADSLKKLGLGDALIIDGAAIDELFARAARNLPLIDVLPEQGANVYDILRRDTLVLTKNAVEALEGRLK